MFAKLSFRNVQRQIRSYLIYFITVALSIAMMFAVNNLSYSDCVRRLADISSDISTIFTMVTVLCCLVTALVLSYATGFMLKLRKKEFGMYLTLGMTRKNIQALFVWETGLLSALALLGGMGAGLVIFQLLSALFASIMEFPLTLSTYSIQGILLTVVISIGLFALSSLASVRYLKRVTVSELLKEEAAQKTERYPVFWCVVCAVLLAGQEPAQSIRILPGSGSTLSCRMKCWKEYRFRISALPTPWKTAGLTLWLRWRHWISSMKPRTAPITECRRIGGCFNTPTRERCLSVRCMFPRYSYVWRWQFCPSKLCPRLKTSADALQFSTVWVRT